MVISEQEVMRKTQLTGLLELICQALELTKTQFETAEDRYGAVGRWLAEAESPLIETATVYPQGSMSLGTTVKPLGRNEFDIDLVCHTPRGKQYMEPSALKKLIGDRLRTNERYRPILEEKPRCWRLNYAGDFHLDITPTIPNPACRRGGELAPDKKLKEWKETNPQGYKDWFEQLAAIPVRFVVADAFAAN
ncbi:nucleotidyltransferase domain-containing protein [Desulfocurvibacter africanus]|uniref:nucleotidyltransferase domain-containing protein n=1 Tax=Desulfocurvibacter africanus TaxID=873 RepID=UPI0004175348|nr:nucleotidyltransferase [Desulfocurvibacter africanus]